MALVCIGCTLIAALPTNIVLFRRRTKLGFILALFNTALAFFLFSFQVRNFFLLIEEIVLEINLFFKVHEKTILLVALPALLLLKWWPNEMLLFLEVSVFSMLPLLARDELLVPALVSTVTFHLIFKCFSNETKHNNVTNISNIVMIIIVAASLLIPAPPRLPDLWPLIISVLSCAHFCLFFVWGNWKHFVCKIS